jgi:phospholipase C
MADVRNVFVLMLENRSFDHMLGFSAITGFDPPRPRIGRNGIQSIPGADLYGGASGARHDAS